VPGLERTEVSARSRPGLRIRKDRDVTAAICVEMLYTPLSAAVPIFVD